MSLDNIHKTFPDAHLNEEGHPVFVKTYTDAECDPISFTFSPEGFLHLDFKNMLSENKWTYLDPETLTQMSKDAKKIPTLLDAWYNTKSGQKWIQQEGV